jgi:hypothetical protein
MNTPHRSHETDPRTVATTVVSTGLLLLVALLAPAPAQAQISSDRPGLGDGASVVAPRTLQAELGYQFARTSFNGSATLLGQSIDAGADLNTHELGQLLLRLGATEGLEIRAGIGSYGWASASGEVSGFGTTGSVEENGSGYLGTSLGAKVRLVQTPAATVSGIATTTLPTETGDFETDDDRARQTLTLAADGALSEGLTLSINAGASFFWSEGDAERDRQVEYLFIPTLTVDVTETTSAYVGYAGFYSDDSQRLDAENTNVVEAGVTVLATPNTQLDVNGGLRVDDNVDSQFFLGIGLAQRF